MRATIWFDCTSRTHAKPPAELRPQISARLGWARKPLGPGPTTIVATGESLTRSITGYGAVARIPHVGEKVEARTQKRRTQLQRDFTNSQDGENYEQEDEAKIEATFQLMVRPSTAAIWRTSRISCSSSAGSMDCGPSESARSGSWWTSTSSPSAPTATAARDKRQYFVATPGSVRRIHLARIFVAFLDFHPLRVAQAAVQYAFWFLGSYHYFLGPTRITGPLFTYPCLFLAALVFARADEKEGRLVARRGRALRRPAGLRSCRCLFRVLGCGRSLCSRAPPQARGYDAGDFVGGQPALARLLPADRDQIGALGAGPRPAVLLGLARVFGRRRSVLAEIRASGSAAVVRRASARCSRPAIPALDRRGLGAGPLVFHRQHVPLFSSSARGSRRVPGFREADWRWLTALTFLVCLPRLVSYSALHYKVPRCPPPSSKPTLARQEHAAGSVVAALSPRRIFASPRTRAISPSPRSCSRRVGDIPSMRTRGGSSTRFHSTVSGSQGLLARGLRQVAPLGGSALAGRARPGRPRARQAVPRPFLRVGAEAAKELLRAAA